MANLTRSARERILVVDDDVLNIQILEEILGEEFCLRCASDGASALTEAVRFRPGLVLMDVMMPGLNGYETTRCMRQIPELRYAKILLVSAKAMVSDRLKGYEAGADDYVSKPFDHDELLAKVRVFLRLKNAEEIEGLQIEFLTVLGHQFRTPLTHVLAAAEVLLTNAVDDPAARQQMARSILEGARRMEWLLDYLNHFHAVRVGNMAAVASPVRIQEMTEQVLLDVSATAEAGQIALVLESARDGEAMVDRYHSSFLVRTLLNEAISASPPGGSVRVG